MVLWRFWRIFLCGLAKALQARARGESLPYPSHVVGAPVDFLCTPFDCDINLHMNNSVYLRLMDLGRWNYSLRTGVLRYFIERDLRPVAARVEITFRKPMPPFIRFCIDTRVIEVQGKRIVFEQVFWRRRDRAVYARGLVEVAILHDKKVIDVSMLSHLQEEQF